MESIFNSELLKVIVMVMFLIMLGSQIFMCLAMGINYIRDEIADRKKVKAEKAMSAAMKNAELDNKINELNAAIAAFERLQSQDKQGVI